MMSQDKCKALFIIIILSGIVFGCIFLNKHIKDEARRKNHAETTAVVYKFLSSRKKGHEEYYYKYSFKVNGITYESLEYFDPNSEDIMIGDTIVIEYDSLNPSNSKPIQLSDN